MSHEREMAPPGLRRVLQDVVHALEEEAVATLAAWLDIPVPSGLWGRDLPEWISTCFTTSGLCDQGMGGGVDWVKPAW